MPGTNFLEHADLLEMENKHYRNKYIDGKGCDAALFALMISIPGLQVIHRHTLVLGKGPATRRGDGVRSPLCEYVFCVCTSHSGLGDQLLNIVADDCVVRSMMTTMKCVV